MCPETMLVHCFYNFPLLLFLSLHNTRHYIKTPDQPSSVSKQALVEWNWYWLCSHIGAFEWRQKVLHFTWKRNIQPVMWRVACFTIDANKQHLHHLKQTLASMLTTPDTMLLHHPFRIFSSIFYQSTIANKSSKMPQAPYYTVVSPHPQQFLVRETQREYADEDNLTFQNTTMTQKVINK